MEDYYWGYIHFLRDTVLCSQAYIYISNLVNNYIPIWGVCVVCDYISRMLVVQGKLINL